MAAVAPDLAQRAQQVGFKYLRDWHWRLNNLYWITDKDGREAVFKMNWAQDRLFRMMHYLELILKARQLGMSTFILLYMLDACLFNSNRRCGIIDVSINDATAKLDKIKFAYERLPEWLKKAVTIRKKNAYKLEFSNGSQITVGTSHRGGTLQYLHVSEFGKICAKFPEKAREIRTGALNTVQAGNFVWIESTAEGQDGDFYDLCTLAQAKQRMGANLTPLDFHFVFYPWWEEPSYELDPRGVVIPVEFARYFANLAEKDGIRLSLRKQAWYVKKAETQLGDMKREYPSTAKEAFEASIEGAIYGEQMELAERQGRVGYFKAVPRVPVHTFWDIGRADYTSIWFVQIFPGPKLRVLGFYQNCLTGMPHYVEQCFGTAHAMERFPEYISLKSTPGIFAMNGWIQGEDFYPHDAKVIEWGSDRSRMEQLIRAGFNPRLQTEMSLWDGINATRAVIPYCEFDEEGCGDGLKVLKSYRWEWDDIRGAWKTGVPRHDPNSHGADAFRGLGTSFRAITPSLMVEHVVQKTPRGTVKFPKSTGRRVEVHTGPPPPQQATLDDLWEMQRRYGNREGGRI